MNAMKDVIQKLRLEAHDIAIERRKKYWDSLTPAEQKIASRGILEAEIGEEEHNAEFKPDVIELEDDSPITPYVVQLQLSLLGCFVSLEDLAERTREERLAASYWATTVGLNASDNDVMIGPRPEWLPARDHRQCTMDIQGDYVKHGGLKEVERNFDVEFREPEGEFVEDPGETITEHQAALLDALEHVEEARNIIRASLGLAEQQPQSLEQAVQAAIDAAGPSVNRLREIVLILTSDPGLSREAWKLGTWLERWLDAGAQDRSDTSVAPERSERSTNGNAATAAVTSDERPGDAERLRTTSTG